VSISLAFYTHLLFAQFPRAQKDTDGLTVFFAHLGSVSVKAACKTLMKLISGCQVLFEEMSHEHQGGRGLCL